MKLQLTATIATMLALAGIAPARADITVGFVTGLSGPLASIGVPNAHGLAAGMQWHGEVDGQKIRIVQLDDASDPTTSARDAEKLATQENVDFLIGSSGAPQSFAMATAAIAQHVPMIAVSPIPQPQPGENGPWVVQIPQPQTLLMQGVVDDMKARGIKTVGFIGFRDALGDLMHGSLASVATPAGITLVNDERYARTDTSVTPQVLKTIALHPDAIMIGGTATPGALPALALRQLGYKGTVYGNNGMLSTDFLRLAGPAADGIICPTGPVVAAEQLPDSNASKKIALEFRAAYQAANGTLPNDGFSAYTFDGWVVFLDAAHRALATGAKPGTPEFRTALRAALFTTKELVGAYGVYNFTPASSFGVDDRSRILVRITAGTFQLLGRAGE